MLRITLLALGTASLLATSTAQADGFFRRLPQPGEYAVYDTVLVVTSDDIEGLNYPEATGSLSLKCVGSTEVNGSNQYWIEVVLNLEDEEAPLQFIWKYLIRERELLNGDAVTDFVRGWKRSPNRGAPTPIQDADMRDVNDPMSLWARAVFRSANGELVVLEHSQTVAYGDRTLRIPSAEQGNFKPDELVDIDRPTPISGWGTWWLHDDAAFGVVATEQQWTIEVPDIGTIDFAIQCSLTEVGIDAVSELPEQN